MLPIWNIHNICTALSDRYCKQWPEKWPGVYSIPIGILLARPDQETARREILPSLEYFHHRSGTDIDFYCAGYGRFIPPSADDPTRAQIVPRFEGETSPWLFSAQAFSRLVSELEHLSRWRYSGGVELLLMTATNDEAPQYFSLDCRRVIHIDIDRARRYGAIESVQHLFEDIFRAARERHGALHVDTLSDLLGGQSILDAALDVLVDLVPKGLGAKIRGTACFAVHDLRRDESDT